MLADSQLQRLTTAAQSAVACEATTEVPAELTVAQWALESGWGAHTPGNNCFGIKAFPGCFGIQMLQTTEVVAGVLSTVTMEFATFPNLAACFEKHANLICGTSPYKQAWQHYQELRSLPDLIEEIAPTYASTPDYAAVLLAILSMAQVKIAIENARLEP